MTLHKCIIVNQHVYKSEGSVCVVAVACTLCNCEGVSTSKDINGDYSSAEHCVILWHDYKNKWCQVYDSSVSVSCNRQLVTQWSLVQHCSLHYNILDNDWDYNTSIRDDYSDNHYYIADMLPFAVFLRTTSVMRVVLLFQNACRSAESFKHYSEYEVNHMW